MSDRSTPLESVVEEARKLNEQAGRMRVRDLNVEMNAMGHATTIEEWERWRDAVVLILTRLADRVTELEAALRRIVETAETREYAPQIARQALSTQPHQDKTP